MRFRRFWSIAALIVPLLFAGAAIGTSAAYAQDAAPAAAAPADQSAAPAAASPPSCDAKTTEACSPNSGDTAWMLTSVALVLMMTVPGLGLFYGGMVRKKNVGDTVMTSFAITCLVTVIYVVCTYSMSFTPGTPFVGGLSRAFLQGIVSDIGKGIGNPNPLAATIPETVYSMFQLTFAIITPALIAGSFAERMKFSSMLWFIGLWSICVYAPVAHWVWGPGGLLNAANDDAWVKVLDFAGGTVVHVNAGIAGLMCALMLGKRKDTGPAHNVVLTFIGAGLLWVGWFGFNAGSNLEASGGAVLAFVNTMVATAAAALSWLLCEWIFKGKPSLLGICSGAVAGLVAVTPASGFSGVIGALVLGLIVSPVCLFFVSTVKNTFHYDDALDVFGVHCVGGIIGALGTGILVNPALGGVGITDYTNIAGNNAGTYDLVTQMIAQGKAVLATLIWWGVGSAILYKVVDVIVGLRPTVEAEREGLDINDHGERAYNM
jgi:ammonium transporter, Amt family